MAIKTQGEKTQADHEVDWEAYGRSAWFHGQPLSLFSYCTSNPALQAAWKRGWIKEETTQAERYGNPPMVYL